MKKEAQDTRSVPVLWQEVSVNNTGPDTTLEAGAVMC